MPEHKANTQHLVEEVHQPDQGHTAQGNPLLNLDPGMVVWTWLVFFIFLIILWKYAWKPILKSLDDREQSIKKSLEDVEEAKKILEEASEKQHQLIEKGKEKAEEIVTRANDSARKMANDIQEKAREESEKLIADARVQIESQKNKTIAELRSEVATLAVSVATKLIEANLDDDYNRKLVENYLEEISS